MQKLKKKLNWKSGWRDRSVLHPSTQSMLFDGFTFVLCAPLLVLMNMNPELRSKPLAATTILAISVMSAMLLLGSCAPPYITSLARLLMKPERFRSFIENYGTWIKPGPGHVWRWDDERGAFVASDSVHVTQLGYPDWREPVTNHTFFLGHENTLPVRIGNIWGKMCVHLHIDDPESLTSEQVGDIWTWYEELVKVAKWRTTDVGESLRSVLTRIQEQCAKPICRDVERGDGYRKPAGARVRAEFPNASLLLDKDTERERAEQTGVRVGDLVEPSPPPTVHEEPVNTNPTTARLTRS